MKELKGINKISLDLIEGIFKKFNSQNKFDIIDKVVLGLYNGIVEKSESIRVLNDNKQYTGTDILLRSMFEASVFLDFILKQHTKDRATAYFLSIQLKEIEVAETILSNNDIGKKIRKYLKDVNVNEKFDFLNETKKINLIKSDFKALTGTKKSDDWLNVQSKPNGKGKLKSFRSLCMFLGDEEIAEYEVIYRMLSQEVHAKEIKEYFQETDGFMHLTKKSSSDMVLSYAKSIVISTSKLLAKHYSENKYYTNRMKVMGYQRYLNNK